MATTPEYDLLVERLRREREPTISRASRAHSLSLSLLV